MKPLGDLQQERNRESGHAWELYESHRNRVTSIILSSMLAGQTNRICLLGAGNCNDVDLRVLAERGAEILLVDLDAEAMVRGVTRQGLAGDSSITCLPGIDLTGLFNRLELLSPESVSTELVDQLAQDAELYSPPELPGGFHVVASLCLLSQMIDAVLQKIPNQQVAIHLIRAIRQRHLQLLLNQCVPGGSAILFTEIVSSDTAPQLAQVKDSDLPGLLSQLLASGNYFTGLHPGIIQQEVSTHPALAALVSRCQNQPPWKWQFLCREYAVTAFVMEQCPQQA